MKPALVELQPDVGMLVDILLSEKSSVPEILGAVDALCR